MFYKSFRTQFRECIELGISKRVIDENNHFWCRKYGAKCMSGLCRDERVKIDIIDVEDPENWKEYGK
jgi:hypothetical protein